MKHRLIPAALVLFGVIALIAPARAGESMSSVTLLTHSLRDLDGGELRLADLRGEVLVVNFWASWCEPCRHEFPWLASLDQELRGQGGRVVAVSLDRDPVRVRRFLESLDLDLVVYVDGPEGLARDLDLASVPFTLVLDRTGKVVHTTRGADQALWKELRGAVDRAVADAALPAGLSKGAGL